MNRRRTAITALALLGVTALSSGAAYATTYVVETLLLKFYRADLDKPGGPKKLYWRIQRAARIVCRVPPMREMTTHPVYQKCYDDAVEDAVEKVNAPALTSLHRLRTASASTGHPRG